MISGYFLYNYIMSTNDFSNQMVYYEYVFGSMMRPWFLCLCNGSIVVVYKGIRSTMLSTTPSSAMNFLIQTASLAASVAAMYYNPVVESAVISCLETDYTTIQCEHIA